MKTADITIGTAYEISYTFPTAKPTARLVRGVVTAIDGKWVHATLDDPRYNPERPRFFEPTYEATYIAPSQVKRPWTEAEAEKAASAAEAERRRQEQSDRAAAERTEWDATYGETTRLIESAVAPFGGSVVEARRELVWDRRWEEGAHTIPRITVYADVAFAVWVAVNTTDDTLADAITDESLSASGSARVVVKAFRTGVYTPTGWRRNVYFKGDAAINEIVRLLSDPEQVAKLDTLRTEVTA